MDAKREIEALRAEILEHNRHYYDEDAPVISDFEYDALMRRLEELEAAHPEFYDPNSPSQRVGGTARRRNSRRRRGLGFMQMMRVRRFYLMISD